MWSTLRDVKSISGGEFEMAHFTRNSNDDRTDLSQAPVSVGGSAIGKLSTDGL